MSIVGSEKSYIASLSKESQFSDISTIRRHRPDYIIVLYIGLLMLLGLIIMYAIGPQRANVLNNAYGSNYNGSYFFIKQTTSLVFSLLAFAVMALVPYTWVTKNAFRLVIFALVACMLLAVVGWLNLGIAQKSLGATRWFNLGLFGSLQPSEFLKFSMLIFTAGFLGKKARQGRINDFKTSIIPIVAVTAVSLLFIIVIQNDLGTGISLIGIIASMLFIGGINKRNGLIITSGLIAIGLLIVVLTPHRIDRVLTYFKGDNTSIDEPSSYHIEHAKLAIGTGGLMGVGIGNSVQATGYLPEAINDSVFAIMGETFGFIGLMVVLAIFIALLFRLLKLMDHLVDIRLKLIAAGVFGWFGTHVILNVASMIGVFPLTGITLPLLSFGGTSMLFITAALGLVFQLSHYTVHSSKLKEAQHEDFGSRWGLRRSRYSSRGSFTRN